MRFEELDLSDNILDALWDMRFDECTPIQEKCIPPLLDGHNLINLITLIRCLLITEVCHYREDDVWHPCRQHWREVGLYGKGARYRL